MDKAKSIDEIKLIPDTIGEAGIEKDLRIGPEVMAAVLGDQDLRVEEPFVIHYEVDRRQESIHVNVDIKGRILTSCSRCLSSMSYPVDLHLQSDYIPAPPEMEGELEAQRLSADTGYYRRDILLGQYIISELVLSLPIIYVCSEDCKGLCPRCGTNLNEGRCECAGVEDPRFQVLRQLKNKL
ncbi:MAG TPA: DUF177 domain-containing protein [Deltaproteobacteria bacterium]|nr:DUF177 domain-containing protein [Deltaproteobacteria bacterium]HPI93654.1 DUF177 domain-containing protein [Deltaproteobacteria bacterium]HPR54574.1 DUF177 domain-containing protein [Deltaproteobacteria bacterium]